MPTYMPPGVYVKEISGNSKLIETVSTSVTAFVGKAIMGPVGKAKLVQSFDEYKNIYGNIASESDTMGLAVHEYFLNGGKSAYICRLLGEDSEAPTANDFITFYERTLEKITDVSIILLPGEYLPGNGTSNSIISATVAHCEKMKDRMVIIDPSPDLELNDATALNGLALPSSSYSALYYPWVKVNNPLYDAGTNFNADKTLFVAPSSFAAGMWSKIDGSRGVWKAPAGIGAQLTGFVGLKYMIEDNEQDQLNPRGINCIRNMPGLGTMIWGARTLASQTDPEWRYIPVRRTAIMIEQSIYKSIQWVVFEPNDSRLWSALRNTIGSFMNDLFRNGAFIGNRSSAAYFVRCGLGDTMTQADIDNGKINIIVGFAPLKPAEFVIVHIKLTIKNNN